MAILEATLTFLRHMQVLLMIGIQGNKCLFKTGQVDESLCWPSRGLGVQCWRGRESSKLVCDPSPTIIQQTPSIAVRDTAMVTEEHKE